MQMLDWLATRLGWAPAPVVPVMIRVRDASGKVVPQVRITGTYGPAARRLDKTVVTASGTFLVDWPAGADRVHLRLSAGAEAAQIELECRRPDPELVVEVRLQ